LPILGGVDDRKHASSYGANWTDGDVRSTSVLRGLAEATLMVDFGCD
jgi:hypothetical protein